MATITLTQDQLQALRARWDEQSKEFNGLPTHCVELRPLGEDRYELVPKHIGCDGKWVEDGDLNVET